MRFYDQLRRETRRALLCEAGTRPRRPLGRRLPAVDEEAHARIASRSSPSSRWSCPAAAATRRGTSSRGSPTTSPSRRRAPHAWRAGWQQLANQIRTPRLLPVLGADPADAEDNGGVDYGGGGGRRVGRQGPQLPGRASPGRSRRPARCTSTSAAIRAARRCRPASPEDYNGGKLTNTERPVLHDPRGTVTERRDHRRPSTPSTRTPTSGTSSTPGNRGGALHGQRARRAAAHLRDGGREEPRPHDARLVLRRSRRPDMRLTPKQLVAGAAAGALGAAGIYELVDRLTPPPAVAPAPAAQPLPPEQHLLAGRPVSTTTASRSLVPPLHHQLVTLRSSPGRARRQLAGGTACARSRRSRRSRRATRPRPPGSGSPSPGACPYFRRHVAEARRPLPAGRPSRVDGEGPARCATLIDAVRFPSDPSTTILETNDVPSCSAATGSTTIARGVEGALRQDLDVLRPTSIRRGFVGGGFDGGHGLPKQHGDGRRRSRRRADPARLGALPRLHLDPEGRPRPDRIANVETLGYSDGGPNGYFRQGTCMHVSHIFEDLCSGTRVQRTRERVATVFRPGAQRLATAR